MSTVPNRRAVSLDGADTHSLSPMVRARIEASDEPIFVEELTVAQNYDGWRLDLYLVDVIPRATRSQVQGYIGKNVEIVPPRRIKASMRVHTGDVIRIVRKERVPPNVPPVHAMTVLARGADYAVVNKPAGILVHRNSREVSYTVDAYLQQLFPDVEHVEAVHRLDRDTSGCLVAAFGTNAVVRWRAAFQNRRVQKMYVAVVHDPDQRWPLFEEKTIDIPLGPDPRSELSVRMGRGPLSAVTRARCTRRNHRYALLELYPIEGRQHQLRAHCALMGTPIVGDKLYAAGDAYFMRYSDDPEGTSLTEALETPYHCLHAARLTLPIDHQLQTFLAPLPHYMQTLVAEL